MYTLFYIACFVMWCLNIVWLCSETVVGLAIARAIGIFAFPLGIILGFV